MEANPVKGCLLHGLVLLSSLLFASPLLPRSAPEFSIDAPDGKTTLLSSYKGRVVVLEFLFVRSQHCARVAKMLNQLQQELGPRGLQAIGIAFDAPNAAASGGDYIGLMAEALHLAYPVGLSQRTSVDAFLGRTGNDMLSVPQVVVIDRAGMIRAATGAANPTLEDINSLRNLLEPLLKERQP
jgi:peroxiredoxin